jgi:hypothetical protein
MQKLLGICLLTALALAATERPAQAWVNSRFSIGLNWCFQSGGNSAGWGLWRNGQVPGPWGDGIIHGVCTNGGQPGPGCGYPGYPGPGPIPYGGAAPAPIDPGHTSVNSNPTQQAWLYGNSPTQDIYQTAGYQNPYAAYNYGYTGYNYGNYNYGNYNYGNYNYGGYDYYNAPAYWYGR